MDLKGVVSIMAALFLTPENVERVKKICIDATGKTPREYAERERDAAKLLIDAIVFGLEGCGEAIDKLFASVIEELGRDAKNIRKAKEEAAFYCCCREEIEDTFDEKRE
jgi:hypothetical protein